MSWIQSMRNLYNLALYFFVCSVVSQMQFVSIKAHQMTYPTMGVDYSRDPSGPIYIKMQNLTLFTIVLIGIFIHLGAYHWNAYCGLFRHLRHQTSIFHLL